jgi:polar amino acid transport system substrate-binding protein
VKDNTRPLGFKGVDGQLQGLEIDIARRLSQEILGKPDRVVFKPVMNQDRLRVLLDGQVDLTIARLSVNGSRARVVNFSSPYYQDASGVVTNNPQIEHWRDLDRHPIAVVRGSSTAYTVLSQIPQAQLVFTSSYQEAKDLLDRGQIAAFVADYSLLVGWVQEYPQYRLLPDKLAAESLAIAMPRGRFYNPLWYFINETMQKWIAEGWLQERIRYWGL